MPFEPTPVFSNFRKQMLYRAYFQKPSIVFSALVFLSFLQILGIGVILQLHAIMECKDKVAKCLKTSLEELTIHIHMLSKTFNSKREL